MDEDIRQEFKSLGKAVGEINTKLTAHVSKDEGLELPKRMSNVETKVSKMPSWPALVTSIGVAGILVGVVIKLTS